MPPKGPPAEPVDRMTRSGVPMPRCVVFSHGCRELKKAPEMLPVTPIT